MCFTPSCTSRKQQAPADPAVAMVSPLSFLHLVLLRHQNSPLPHPLLPAFTGPLEGPEAWGWHLVRQPISCLLPGLHGHIPGKGHLGKGQAQHLQALAPAAHQGHWSFCGSLLTFSRSWPQKVVVSCWLVSGPVWEAQRFLCSQISHEGTRNVNT